MLAFVLIAALAAAVQALAAEAAAQGGPYEQLLYVHDWLTTHNEYNSDAANEGAEGDYFAWTPLAALTNEGQPICEGYSKAFKLVCDELAYYAPAVTWAVTCGVTNGMGWDEQGNALFMPEFQVNRGQAVTFLWRANWCPEPETTDNRFSDVAAGSYYEKAVLWAIENGITNGTTWDEEAGVYEFSPDAPVTRGQMLTFLWRSVDKPGETETYEGKQWFSDAERWGDESGCIYGTAEAYETGAQCPRADVVYYLWQAVLSMAG